MKRTTRVLVLLTVLAVPLAVAQGQGTGAGVSAVATPKRDAKMSEAPARATDPNLDVRFCLDSAANLEVIACADKYRPDRRKAAS